MHHIVKFPFFFLVALMISGCATTYVPISWGQGDLVKKLSREDLFLATLFNRYDPDRTTLRVAGASFDEVMMPDEVKYHLGAYRQDTKLIYRNLFQEYSEKQLRSVMLHELAHHVWYNAMSADLRLQWSQYLSNNPTVLQAMVRSTYKAGTDYDSEDFAFTVEYARPGDIEELSKLKIITAEERDKLMKEALPAGPATGSPKVPLVRTAEADRSRDEGADELPAKNQGQPHEIY